MPTIKKAKKKAKPKKQGVKKTTKKAVTKKVTKPKTKKAKSPERSRGGNSKDKLKGILDSIRPALERDGGNLELVRFDEKKGLVEISFQGACAHCPLADVTLHHLIEAEVRAQMPQVKQVRAV